ncbi:MAG: hypothetical protein IIA85_00465 [Nanoarchaeota archaeon]|nr:hypothetical protein [Nanoarchaeota archaeon]
MAIQSPLPNIKTSTGQSSVKIAPTKDASMAAAKPSAPMTPMPPKQSTPMVAAGVGTPQPNSLSSTMPVQDAPKSRKLLWILLGIFGFLAVLGIIVGLFLWLR